MKRNQGDQWIELRKNDGIDEIDDWEILIHRRKSMIWQENKMILTESKGDFANSLIVREDFENYLIIYVFSILKKKWIFLF